eukprot:1036543-Lingulodinium_polyedra.AAC.1
MPLFYATYMKCRQADLREWERQRQGPWDDAIRGGSCLQAALTRRLLNELCEVEGKHAAEIYYDMEKFYEMISWALS